MNDLQAKSTNTLALCPFCGGEAEMLTAESMNGGYLFGIMCNDCRSRGDVYDTEVEAIAAWNTRAERTCENVGERCDFACSECGARLYTETSDCYTMILGDEETILLKPNYCPYCGCKVVGE